MNVLKKKRRKWLDKNDLLGSKTRIFRPILSLCFVLGCSHEEFLFTFKPVPASCWGPLAADRPALLSLQEPRVALAKPRTRVCQAVRFTLTEPQRGQKDSHGPSAWAAESGLYPAVGGWSDSILQAACLWKVS